MKRIITLSILCFSLTGLKAQISNIDSLEAVLRNEKQDTTRVLLLCDLSYAYSISKPEKSRPLAFEALELSRRIGFLKGEAKSLNMVALRYRGTGNTPKAMELFLQALKINEKINYLDGLSNNLGSIGVLYNNMGDHRQALRYHFKAKALREKLNNKQEICLALMTIGRSYKDLNILDSARLYTQQAYDLATQTKYYRVMGSSLALMGDIHSESGQNTLALEFYRLSTPFSIKAGSPGGPYGAMASVFKKTGQLDSSLIYARQAMAITRKRGALVSPGLSTLLYSIHKSKGNVDSALFYLEMAKATNDSVFSQQKQQALQSLVFDEKLRQQDLVSAELKVTQERNLNLQYAAILVGLITFIILFVVLSRSVIVRQRFIEFFGILGLLAFFEFINLFMHPHLADLTHHSPVLMLLIMVGIAALLIPAHHRLEKWITNVMVEKNKNIRLVAAKKTIATLEGA